MICFSWTSLEFKCRTGTFFSRMHDAANHLRPVLLVLKTILKYFHLKGKVGRESFYILLFTPQIVAMARAEPVQI